MKLTYAVLELAGSKESGSVAGKGEEETGTLLICRLMGKKRETTKRR